MTPSRSPFASASVPRHLARGGGGLLAFCGGLVLLHAGGALAILGAVGAIVLAVVLLRGCPMCWVIGLVETLALRAPRTPPSSASGEGERP